MDDAFKFELVLRVDNGLYAVTLGETPYTWGTVGLPDDIEAFRSAINFIEMVALGVPPDKALSMAGTGLSALVGRR